jgi:superfamily II DNA or RNA helicase
LADVVRAQSDENVRVYATSPIRVDEDAGQEMNLAHGGYGKRQLLELVQNGADAMLGSPGGRIEVLLTEDALYCANQGDPINPDGIRALLHAHLSRKRDAEIGRFGLGFKSVLGVTDCPEFFCREVSFGFDAVWAKEQISQVAPDRERYPALRLAKLLDPSVAADEDPILADLMSFATTVVRLPRTLGDSAWLSDDMANFDPAFMLFSPHVGELDLVDRTTGQRREIRLHSKHGEVTITEGSESRRWRVFKSKISPSPEAKREAWELSARDELPVVWAVPIEGRLAVGRFWAFFPLRDETTLTGIANAPWQINDDRTGLLENSRLNIELLDALAELVLSNVDSLVKPEDPGWVLDVIPARGLEARCWGDKYLTSRFYEAAAGRPIIPDQDGVLRPPSELRLPPADASRAALEAWALSPSRPQDWCHATAVSTTTRRSRVERLLEISGQTEASPARWLEALIPEDLGTEVAAQVLRTAAAFITTGAGDEASRRAAVHRSHIVLDADRTVAAAKPGEIFMPAEDDAGPSRVRLVHRDVVLQPWVHDALVTIGIEQATPSLELRAYLRSGLRDGSDEEWSTLWSLVRLVSAADEAAGILRTDLRGRLLALRTVGGTYLPISQVLLPGTVVPGDGSRDAGVAIDVEFHREELEVIRAIGAETGPTAGCPTTRDPIVRAYQTMCTSEYIKALPRGNSQPSWDYMVFDHDNHVGPLEPLRHLSEEGKAAFTAELIAATTDWKPWVLRHETRENVYPPMTFPSPALWAIKTEGRLRTSLGLCEPDAAWGQAFLRWGRTVPVCELSDEEVGRFGVTTDLTYVPAPLWVRAFDALGNETDDSEIGEFYAFAAANDVEAPATIRCRLGTGHAERPAADVVVTHGQDAFDALKSLGKPAVLVSSADGAAHLVARWGLQASGGHVRQEVHWVEAEAPAPLGDAFPTLRRELESHGLAQSEIVSCVDIFETVTTEAGTKTVYRDFARSGEFFLWKNDLGLEEALRRVAAELPFAVGEEEIHELAAGRWKQARHEKLAAIRECPNDPERLLKAIGEQRLRVRLPIGLVEAVQNIHGPLGPTDIARLVLVVQGYDVLRYLKEDLQAEGLEPPGQWAGGRDARGFVRDLGFADEYAGAPHARRDRELVVLGPPNLKPLHDYQERIVEQVDRLLAADDPHPRGLISLPTGSGKTRVAVEALVRALVDHRLASPVLWIAQSDELCEQAVQSWSEVWRAIGTTDELRIGRLWGPTNEVPEAEAGHQVVVGGIDKLRHRVDDPAYGWLAGATCVVVDEAHTAITPEYTQVLRWLGISAAGRAQATRVPLLGLTATPFRGVSREETERLVNRFGGRRLDRLDAPEGDYEAMYRELQEMGVLAAVDGEELETGTTIDVAVEVSDDQRTTFEQRRDLTSARVFDRIATDVDRNTMLLRSITERPDDWPILLFAVSVEHAHTMAALLEMQGVSAAAIDYRTEPENRRRYIDRFRRGDLRVLANFNVLAQGFDAPAVRAIYVTRPTFSPNNYQQMIGRGLRGPKNGGKERCLIVNVRDNWTMYGDKLAFYEFEHLWKPDESR